MLRDKFIRSEYEKSLIFILHSSNILSNIEVLLLLIIDYMGTNKPSSPLEFTEYKQRLINEQFFFHQNILYVAPSNTGKTALLNSIKEFSHHCLQFDFDEMVHNTLEGSFRFFKAMLMKEALRYDVSLTFDKALPEKNLLVMAYQELLEKIYAKDKKKIIIKIDNYDTPLLASYYYHYYYEMIHWLKMMFNVTYPKFYQLVLAGLASYDNINYPHNIRINYYYFNNYHALKNTFIYFASKKPSAIGDTWIPELIQKNAACFSTLRSSSFIFATFESLHLKLDAIDTDHNQFYKLLTYLGYFSFVEKSTYVKHRYKLTPHPYLLKILSQPLIEAKDASFFKHYSPLFSQKSLQTPEKKLHNTTRRLHFNKYNATKNTEQLSSLKKTWDAFNKGKLKSIYFDAKQLNNLKITLSTDHKELQKKIMALLPNNKKLKHLKLNHFSLEHFEEELELTIKKIPSLKYLCISNNHLTSLDKIISVLDGKTHRIEAIDFSDNPITIDQQIILAKWMESYPAPIKIYFDTTEELDACILIAIHKNTNIQFFSNALFQAIRTSSDTLNTIVEDMKHQERLIDPSATKRSCIIS